MNYLLEPQCTPQPLPDLMLLDELDEDGSNENWGLYDGAAGSLYCSSARAVAPSSAPVPIASGPRCCYGDAADLVDSLESTQTLLGASLHEQQPQQCAMRFVPVPVAPVPPLQLPHAQAQQFSLPGAAPPSQGALFGSYDALQALPPVPQPHHLPSWQPPSGSLYQQTAPRAQQYSYEAPSQPPQQHMHSYPSAPALPAATWDLAPAPSMHTTTCSGISSFDMQCGYSIQFGQPMPLPVPTVTQGPQLRRTVSLDGLPSMPSVHPPPPGYEPAGSLSPVAEGESLGSEGSDADTLGDHHHPHYLHQGLPVSHSAPTLLERTNSSRRGLPAGGTRGGGAAGAGSTASPRPICLKVKAMRPRPAAAVAAARAAATVAGAGGDASPRPARLSARRSVMLSAAAVADDDAFVYDSDAEPVLSAAASEERRSGGSGGSSQQSTNVKKKHNPWSLTETEALVEGVRLLGPSKWAEIKKLAVAGICELLTNRSAVDLKDKWRNLTRVAKLPKTVLKVRAHKSTSDIPLDLLLTVKELMDMSRD